MKTLLLIALIVSNFTFAQQPAFNPESNAGKLYQYAEFANVGKSQYSINDILDNTQLDFQNLKSENHDLGFTSDTYWVRFKLKNTSDSRKTYYLETARPITDVVNLYGISKTIKKLKSGDQIPFNERALAHRQIIFKIVLEPKSENQFYIELKSDGETINIPLNLYDESTFLITNYRQQLFLGLFYGVLLLAGLIYLFFYSSLNNKAFLYYGLYVLSIALMQAALDGFVYQYFFSNGGYINSRMVLISALFSNFFLLRYCEYFLNVKLYLPDFSKLYNTIYMVLAVLLLLVFLNSKTLELAYPLSNFNGFLSLILILTTVFKMRFKKVKIDPYFSVGVFFLVIGLLGFVMNNLGMLPTNFYTLNSSKFGTGFEVVFLSLSMTNLLKKLREENEKSQILALKKSEEVSELKTFFMSNMSHELRTPINAIMGIVETELANQKSTIEERKKYQIIRNASISLLSNVNDVLDFEKIEKNEIQLKNETFNPSIALNQISENWKSEALKKGLNYHFEMDSEIPASVIGDSDRLLQVVNNVLSNAVKYTNTGGVVLKLKCVIKAKNICQFSFQVSDSGIGMSEENQECIFDSYNQMRLNHKRQYGGIGLGLTIAKHLVTLFNGVIKVESELNKGTDVFIEIPLKTSEKKETLKECDQQTNEKPMHILIVEDNKLNQMVMRKLLSSFPSISFAVVENGKEAIETLQKEVYDLILMDLQMPIMDGYEATEFIRSGKLGQAIGSIPIIAVTADAMAETRERVLNMGMNDYMTKPVKRDLLMEKIQRCTNNVNTELNVVT
ncbi:7TM diverse intracellular signaling domain-containing protein [Aestuariibaculum sp. YM273]|uniref:hybrid sensor histidine kinase/response regulator n=1 Tax=Aestuariibaculum sp. YM273 TaxID=3070659 RepID=UPI0027DD9C0D|nr:hybrid sensor histidine kinase/response regulator [Aestuariibaculum sp. YM273]WMI64145.1 7TM diverse intracellular signaling domain-containing protein [Aestuariibaculum sp. YM273]